MNAATLRLAALLLDYPDRALFAATAELAQAAADIPASAGGPMLQAFLARRSEQQELVAQEEYVATFDFHKRASLYLSYYRDGDRRQRGTTLLGLKRRYRAAGLELKNGELPDYLPVVLEFAALEPAEGEAVLRRLRPGIELLHAALHRLDSPYAQVIAALVKTLPAISDAEAEQVRRAALDGPPEEQVGLEPFAPPEVMPFAGAEVMPAAGAQR